MKIIDQTPFYSEDGVMSLTDRAKAVMQFGMGWFKEMEAQKHIVSVFDKALDKNFTLLRNVTPPGLEARIPFILVGPSGVYVMYVTPLKGMFRAKGDEWGSVNGGNYRPEKPNLLIRTEKMARAVQVFLQRQGYMELNSVEAILLCSDPSVTVDSLRPIIRVVMSDALERLAVSIAQARVILSPETAYNMVKRILNPVSSTPQDQPAETPAAEATAPAVESAVETSENPYVPSFALPESEVTPAQPSTPPFAYTEPEETPVAAPPPPRPRRRISGKQWAFLVALFVIWLLIMIFFVFMIYRDLFI
jgi:hypothetical protein